jgi:hypothetical protein
VRREEKDFGNLGISHFKFDALFFFFGFGPSFLMSQLPFANSHLSRVTPFDT